MDCRDCISFTCPIPRFCDKTWRGVLNLHRQDITLLENQYLVHEETTADSVFFLAKGKLQVLFTAKGGKQDTVIRLFEPGSIIDCFNGANPEWHFSLMASEHSVICQFLYNISLLTDKK